MQIQTLKGFRDFLPADAAKRQWVRDKMVEVAEKWGYEPIETPSLESYSLFQGEIGEDEKLFYKFIDNGGREVMLRYDQ
ncbi:histidine--tRNA ligase, partial [Candidatus Collierbacteria bacterium CG10_big_fil_rev_8_21_14_0_10_43_36]